MDDLDNILNDESTSAEPEQAKPEETGEEATEEKPEASDEALEAKEDDGTPPPESEEEKKSGPDEDAFTAMRKAMTEQHRATKARLAEVEAQLQAKQEEAAPDPIDDPEAYQAHQDARLDRKLFDERCNFSYEVMVDAHGEEDMREKEEAFAQAMQADATLQGQLLKHAHPAKFIYEQGKNHLERVSIGDPVEYANKKVAEAIAEVEKKFEAKVAELTKEFQGANLPKSLADEQSQGGMNRAEAPVHTPLDKLIPY